MQNLVGQTLGKYQILEEIGRGGMGAVYKAYDPILDRYVAIKVLAPHLVWEREFVTRFLQEARAAAKLKHPNIVTVHDVGEQEGTYYIVMEYIEGRPLSEIIRREGPLPPERVARIITQVASALEAAHRKGLVHRDVKPGNILVGEGDKAVLTDFGIAKALAGTKLTRTGMMIGTPGYIAPEQVKGGEVGPAADQYALGVVVYEMLTGKPPFEGDTAMLLYKHANERPPSLRALNREVPKGVEDVVLRALAKVPGERWGSVTEFAYRLKVAVKGKKVAVTKPRVPSSPLLRLPAAGRRWLLGLLGVTGVILLLLLGGMILELLVEKDEEATKINLSPSPLSALMQGPSFTSTSSLGTLTHTPMASLTPTFTPLLIPTSTPTPTATPIPSNTPTATPIPTNTPTPHPTPTPAPKPRPLTLFADDFSNNNLSKWKVIEGTWFINDGVLVGISGNEDSRLIAGNTSWTDYVIQGRFMMDVQNPQNAVILFRVQDASPGIDRGRYYLFANYIDYTNLGIILWKIDNGATKISSVPYTFHRGVWYRFKLVVQGNRVDYFIEDRLILRYQGLAYPNGGFGLKVYLGTVQFDDIVVTRLT